MKKKIIEIVLHSDTCVSDGGIYNSAVDTDICQDDFGFPYIPGKRIKGCLRECALELNDWGADIKIKELFGGQGNEKGKVIIKNAYIKDRDSMIESIKKLSDITTLCHPQNVLQCYSYIRTQTALDFDTGVADDKSLRTIRVANKGLVFQAEVIFLSKSEDIPKLEKDLEECLKVFRHIGIARTRGLGEIKATLSEKDIEIENNKEKKVDYIENSTKLYYKIYLKEPIICKSVGEQEAASMDYIEGSKILGMIGQRLKDNGEEEVFLEWLKEWSIVCSNAYPFVNGKRLYEVPASVFDIKNDKENYRNKIYLDKELESSKATPSCDEGLQLNQAGHRYVYMTEDGKMVKYSVEMEERYHHSRPADKSIGRVMEGVDGSQLYQISSIKDGQAFCGFIEGNSSAIKKIYDLLVKDENCFIGYGRSGEYGGCSILVEKLEKDTLEHKEVETNSFYALLKSPTIIYNDKAMYSTNTEDLQAEILKNILLDDSLEKANETEVTKYMNIVPLGGYNVTWGCRKPTILAFDKGTVLVFKAPKDTAYKIKTGQFWIGERCIEGFGEVIISPLADSGAYKGKIVKQIENNKELKQDDKKCYDIASLLQEDFIQRIIEQRFEELLRFKASETAENIETKIGIKKSCDALKPTISNMILMCKEKSEKEKKDIETIWRICQDRFDKNTGKKDKKLECAEKIIKYIRSIKEDSLDEKQWNREDYPLLSGFVKEFEEQYCITGIFDKEKASEWELNYLTELLIQIKYVLRKNEEMKADGE